MAQTKTRAPDSGGPGMATALEIDLRKVLFLNTKNDEFSTRTDECDHFCTGYDE